MRCWWTDPRNLTRPKQGRRLMVSTNCHHARIRIVLPSLNRSVWWNQMRLHQEERRERGDDGYWNRRDTRKIRFPEWKQGLGGVRGCWGEIPRWPPRQSRRMTGGGNWGHWAERCDGDEDSGVADGGYSWHHELGFVADFILPCMTCRGQLCTTTTTNNKYLFIEHFSHH